MMSTWKKTYFLCSDSLLLQCTVLFLNCDRRKNISCFLFLLFHLKWWVFMHRWSEKMFTLVSLDLTTLLLLGCLTTFLLYCFFSNNSNSYPPGPFALPIIGNVHQIVLSGSIAKFCEHNRKRFGNVSVMSASR